MIILYNIINRIEWILICQGFYHKKIQNKFSGFMKETWNEEGVRMLNNLAAIPFMPHFNRFIAMRLHISKTPSIVKAT